MKRTLNALTDQITDAQVYLERADTVMAGIADDYFNENTNNPETSGGKE
jgi:hypothetical protein